MRAAAMESSFSTGAAPCLKEAKFAAQSRGTGTGNGVPWCLPTQIPCRVLRTHWTALYLLCTYIYIYIITYLYIYLFDLICLFVNMYLYYLYLILPVFLFGWFGMFPQTWNWACRHKALMSSRCTWRWPSFIKKLVELLDVGVVSSSIRWLWYSVRNTLSRSKLPKKLKPVQVYCPKYHWMSIISIITDHPNPSNHRAMLKRMFSTLFVRDCF